MDISQTVDRAAQRLRRRCRAQSPEKTVSRGFLRSWKAALRLAAAGAIGAVLAQAVTLARFPYLQNVRDDRASVIWTTLELGAGYVEYSIDLSFSRQSAPATRQLFPSSQTGISFPYYQYQADLTGLRPDTAYFYRIVVDGEILASGEGYRFRTAGSGRFSLLVFGDSGFGGPEQYQLAARMRQEQPDLVLHTGDLVYPTGAWSDYQDKYFNPYFEMMRRVPFFPTLGNHEYMTENGAPYVAVHAPPSEGVPSADRGRYYSFDWANVHFVALDTNLLTPNLPFRGSGQMLQWLEDDLRKTRKFWRIAYFHHGPYLTNFHEGDPTAAAVRRDIVPILERYGVQIVFGGHEHNYQRTRPLRNGVPGSLDGTVYVVTGGGGGRLYAVTSRTILERAESTYHYLRVEVDDTRITVYAIRIDGSEMDRFTLQPRPLISSDSIVNSAAYTPALAPGALISIFGFNLAAREARAPNLPLPSELAGTIVRLNGRRLPLLYVSPGQINAQLLPDVVGSATLRVSIADDRWAEASIPVAEVAPAVFSVNGENGPVPLVVHAGDGQMVSEAVPAETGETLTVYLTGLGRVNPDLDAGQAAPLAPLYLARADVEVRMGSVTVPQSFAGLTPGFAGLYQVNLLVIPEVPAGSQTLRIAARGVASNPVLVPVRTRTE